MPCFIITTCRRFIFGASLFIVLALLAAPAPAAPLVTEAQLIERLHSPKPSVVLDALGQLQNRFPQSANAIPAMKSLLAREAVVKRKAARTLGYFHAELNLDEVTEIFALLKSPDANEATDGLKALRGLKEPEDLREKIEAEVAPLLQDKDTHIVRDACRTMAVVGNKNSIPLLEPLLKDSRTDVRQDAKAAIDRLNTRQ